MRILLYLSSVAPFKPGGAQSTFQQLVRSLRHRGFRVDEVYLRPLSWSRGAAGSKWGLPVYSLATNNNGMPTTRSLLRRSKSFCAIFVALLVSRPDIVYVHFIKTEASYFIFYRKIFRYRLILSARGSDVLVSRGNADRDISGILGQADAVIANSDAVKRRVEALAPREIPVVSIHNGVDLSFWSRPLRGFVRHPRIVAVGRLEVVKGFDVLVRAFSQLHRDCANVELELIGDGSQREMLELLAKEIGIGDKVSFLGAMDREAVRERLWQASVLAMPSRSEGFGLAALEGLAAGLPVVGSNVGGLPELISDGAGVLVAPECPDELADGLITVLKDRDSFAANAVRRASLFSWEEAVDEYVSVFRQTRA